LITFAALKVKYFQESVINGLIQSVLEFISAVLENILRPELNFKKHT